MKEFKTNKKAFYSQVKIYKSLRRILLTKPLSDVTVADISQECGISRSTFYRNFNNVIELWKLQFSLVSTIYVSYGNKLNLTETLSDES